MCNQRLHTAEFLTMTGLASCPFQPPSRHPPSKHFPAILSAIFVTHNSSAEIAEIAVFRSRFGRRLAKASLVSSALNISQHLRQKWRNSSCFTLTNKGLVRRGRCSFSITVLRGIGASSRVPVVGSIKTIQGYTRKASPEYHQTDHASLLAVTSGETKNEYH